MLKLNLLQHKEIILPGKIANFPRQYGSPHSSRQYLIILVVAITGISINYFYSIAMMLLTTFTLAYLTKGSRCK